MPIPVHFPATESTAARRVGLYTAAQVLNAILALLLLGALTRLLGRAGFGEFSYAFVVASLGSLLADFGLGPWLTREVARSPDRSRRLLSDVLRRRAFLVPLTFALVLGVMAWHLRDSGRLVEIAWMLLYVTGIGYAGVYESLLMGHGRAGRVGASLVVGKVFEIAAMAGLFLFRHGLRVDESIGALAIASGMRMLFARELARRQIRSIPVERDRERPPGAFDRRPILAAALPFALSLFVSVVYSRVDVLLLERMTSAEALGLYTAAYRVLEALLLMPRSIVGVHFPVFSGSWTRGELTRDATQPPFRLLTALALAAAAGLAVLPGETLNFLFGGSFRAGESALRLLGLAAIPLFMNQFHSMLFGAIDRQSTWLRLLLIGLAVNVGANLFLIPRYGIAGAAGATLISESLLLAMATTRLSRALSGWLPFAWLVRAVASASLMGLAVAWLPGPFLLRVLAGMVLFPSLSLLFGVISAEDRDFLRGLITPGPAHGRKPGSDPGEAPGPTPTAVNPACDLSVVILTRDSEATLSETLASVSFAPELIVLDSGSRDGTLALARRCGARVIERPFDDWADQRNFGHAAAKHGWVLALDSDERLDAEVAGAIRRITRSAPGPDEPAGWNFLVRSYFLGHPLLHGGLERDEHLRLAWKPESRWVGVVHEKLLVHGLTGALPGVVHHQTGRTLEQRLRKARLYSRLRAAEWERVGRRYSIWRTLWEPPPVLRRSGPHPRGMERRMAWLRLVGAAGRRDLPGPPPSGPAGLEPPRSTFYHPATTHGNQ